jgi:hypothetical protein
VLVLYGRESLNLIITEENRLRTFYKVLRKVSGPKREVAGKWRTIHEKGAS